MSKRIIEQKWFLTNPSLGHPEVWSGTVLLGGDDQFSAPEVCDCLVKGVDLNEAREVAKHIVDLHNASLKTTDKAAS